MRYKLVYEDPNKPQAKPAYKPGIRFKALEGASKVFGICEEAAASVSRALNGQVNDKGELNPLTEALSDAASLTARGFSIPKKKLSVVAHLLYGEPLL